MNKHDYKQNAYYLIYLIRCVLNNKIPAKEKLDKMDLSGVFDVAKSHSLTAIAAYALESAGIYQKDFEEEKAKAIRKNILLDFERANVISELEKAGIWYCPLKGCIIKDWYPEIGMREMADNDILCDENKMPQIRECMERLGFKTTSFGDSHQDKYQKPPVSHFEMHSSLLEPRHGDVLYNYYRKIKAKLIKDDDNEYGFHFSNEYFYIYFIAHEYKHFAVCGIGLRSVADTYIVLRHFDDTLNWEYIKNELALLQISEFEQDNRELALKLFSGEELTADEKKLLDYHISSGTYGSVENRISNGISEGTSSFGKAKYIINRLSLPEQTLKEFHPFFYKHKVLRPILYSRRLIHKAKYRNDSLKREVHQLFSTKKSKKNSFGPKLKRSAEMIGRTKLGFIPKKAYDAFLTAEYHILSLVWRLKGGRMPTAEERRLVVENVTFIYKSFERQYLAKRLFDSIQKHYPGVRVIIADDSREPISLSSKCAKVIRLPFNTGLSYGLNCALEKVTTPYTMRMDDDEILTLNTMIHNQLKFLMNHKEVDMCAVQLCTPPFLGSPKKQAEKYYRFDMSNAPRSLKIPHLTRIDKTHIISGKTPNTFLIRTDKYKELGYDNNIRMIDHHEFSYRAAGVIVSAMDESAYIFHCHNWFDTNYSGFRNDTSSDMKYIREKHGNRY